MPALIIGLVAFLVLGTASAAGGVLLLTRSARLADLEASLSAYLAGDCTVATDRYASGTRGMLLGSPPAPSSQQRKAIEECRSVLNAQGDDAAKLTTYARLARTLGDSPTRAALRRQVADVTKRSDALAPKATGALCSSVLTLRFFDLLPAKEDTLPGLLVACGRILGATKQLAAQANAITLYRSVRKSYPTHPLVTSATAAEARLRIALIAGTGNAFSQYTPLRTGAGSRSKLVVLNGSPATLIVSITGNKQARVVEIPPCPACVIQRTLSYRCKKNTPGQTLLLPKGRYTISYDFVQPGVQYSADSGPINLTQGGAYRDCNFIYKPA